MKKTVDESQLTPKEIYLARLADFERYYLSLVIFTAAAVGVGIVIAVITSVLLGVALVVLSASVYVYFSVDEARKQLGIGFSNVDGHIVIKRLVARYGECAVVPSRFIWADVTHIGDGALASAKNAELKKIYLPRGIECIGKDIFGKIDANITVCYEGTAEEWSAVECLTDLSGCELVFECEYPRLPKKPKKQRRIRESDSSDGEVAE